MATLGEMAQQHILAHESRLKHVDELLDRAHRGLATTADTGISAELENARRERDKLAGQVDEYRLRPPEQWSEEEFERTGPMVIWDTLAQTLEKLVERIER